MTEVRDLLAELVQRATGLVLDVPARRGKELLALPGGGDLRLVGQVVGRPPGARDDVLGLLARLAQPRAVLLEQLVGLPLRPGRRVDRLLDRPGPPVERLRDPREDELVEDPQRCPEQEQRPDHEPEARAHQEAAAPSLLGRYDLDVARPAH